MVATQATALANMRCASPEPPAGGGTGETRHISPSLKHRFLTSDCWRPVRCPRLRCVREEVPANVTPGHGLSQFRVAPQREPHYAGAITRKTGRPPNGSSPPLLGKNPALRDRNYVLCSRTLFSFDHIELHCRALSQGPKTIRLNRAVVAEAIFAPILRCNESETFLVIEPLHCASHTYHLLRLVLRVSECPG